jgi:hypothetical protein
VRPFLIILLSACITNTYGQAHLSLRKVLEREFPKESEGGDRWVFHADRANIEQINKPLVKTILPNYDFYKVAMTNLLGYHVNEGTCLILFDSIKSKVLLVEPLWYGGTSQSFLKLFVGRKFHDQKSLMEFLPELNDLLQTGSNLRFVQTDSNNKAVHYDLTYFKGSIIRTGNGEPASTTIRYNTDKIWRKIRVDLKNRSIIRYTEINPVTNERLIID